MSAELVFARESAPLKKYVLRKAAAALAERRRALLIVPSQATFMFERDIMEECGAPGFITLEVLSFEKLTSRLLSAVGGRTLPTVDTAGGAMLIKRALLSCGDICLPKGDDELPAKLWELFAELKREGVTPERLKQASEAASGQLGQKLRDLSVIYGAAREAYGSRRDAHDLTDYAIDHMDGAELISGAEVLVYGFDVFFPQRLRVMEKLARYGKSITVTFQTPEAEAPDGDIYSAVRSAMDRVEKLFRGAGVSTRRVDLNGGCPVRVGSQLYAYPYEHCGGVRIIRAADRRHEVMALAEGIRDRAAKGIPLSEMAVLAASQEDYAVYIRDVFGEMGIPYFMDERRPLSASSLAVLVLSAIDVISKRWRQHDLLRHIKTGLLPITEAEADLLCSAVRELGLKGYELRQPFRRAVLADAEPVRAAAMEGLCRLSEAEDIARGLLDYLEYLGCKEALEAEAQALEEAGLPAEALFTRQVYAGVAELLEFAAETLPGAEPEALRDALAAGFGARSIAVIPPCSGEVVIGDLKRSFAEDVRALFVLGVNDGVLPSADEPAELITAAEAAAVADYLPDFPKDTSLEVQKYNIVRAFMRSDDITVTFDGSKQPSVLIHRLTKLTGAEPEDWADRPLGGTLGAAEALRAMLDGEWEPTDQRIAAIASQRNEVRERLFADGTYDNAVMPIGREAAASLYGTISGSATFAESYYACPYRHFIEYGLRPRTAREPEETPLDTGNYIHDLLAVFTRGLLAEGGDMRTVSDERIVSGVDAAAKAVAAEHNMGIFTQPENRLTEEALRRETVFTLRVIREQLRDTAVRVAGAEMAFGYGAPVEVTTRDGDRVALRGRIDRVDIVETSEGDYLRIVDYKTGSRGFDATRLYYGLSLQLMYYLKVMAERFKHTAPAGGFYFNIQMPFEEGRGEQLYKMRMKGFLVADERVAREMDSADGDSLASMDISMKKLREASSDKTLLPDELSGLMDYSQQMIAEAAAGIYEGRIPIAPAKGCGTDSCKYCGAHTVCRFDPAYGNGPVRIEKKTKADALNAANARRDGE